MNKRYDNGELITKERMEDEEWYYSEYQPFLEFACGSKCTTVGKLYDKVLKSKYIGGAFNISESQKEKLLRFCVMFIERRVSEDGQDIHPNPKFDKKQIDKIL